MSEPEVVKRALEAVRGEDLEAARSALMEALTEFPERLDLVHTLSIIELQVGRPDHALDLTQKASAVALERRDPGDLELLPLLLLAQGAAQEELNQPAEALRAYDAILQDHPGHPLAAQGKGHLLLAWGDLEEGLSVLQRRARIGRQRVAVAALTIARRLVRAPALVARLVHSQSLCARLPRVEALGWSLEAVVS